MHKSELTGLPVAWWDPEHLERETRTKPGLRRHWILEPDDGDGPTTGAASHDGWREARAARIARGSAKSLDVSVVTRLVEEATREALGLTADAAEAVSLVAIPGRDPTRPGGKRFGTLVHEVLAHAAFDDAPSQIEALAKSLARTLDATDDEVAAAIEAVTAALAHPLLRGAAESAVCHREMPVVHRADDGRLIEGVPDLAFRAEADGPWTVRRLQDRPTDGPRGVDLPPSGGALRRGDPGGDELAGGRRAALCLSRRQGGVNRPSAAVHPPSTKRTEPVM